MSLSLSSAAFCDFDREVAVTRRVLARLPAQHWSWKPHEKSMSLGRLATHTATLLQSFLGALQTDELDLSKLP